jgi:hypothetical protein
MMGSLTQLRARPGEEVTAAKWNALVRAVERLTPLRRPGVLRREMPDGILTTYRPRGGAKAGGGTVSYPFKVQLVTGDVRAQIRMRLGFIGGLEASIEDKPFMRPDETGEAPLYTVPDEAWSEIGGGWQRALLYLRAELSPSFYLVKVIPEARAAAPGREDLKAWKLVAVLMRQGKDGTPVFQQMTFFNQGFAASERRGNRFRPWFWAN